MTRFAAYASKLEASPKGGADRVFVLLAALVYFCLLYYIYIGPLRRWEYLGFPLGNYSSFDILLCLFFSMLPAALMPTAVKLFSTYINWCLYFFVYVPAVLYPVLQGLHDGMLTLATAIFVSFLVMIALSKLKIKRLLIQISSRAWRALFIFGYVSLIIYSLSVFGGSLSLTDITDVYGQRSLAGELSAGTLVGYATGILAGSFNPLLMGLGLYYRKYWLIGAGIAGQVFVFATFAQKSTLLSPGLVIALWLLAFRRGEINSRGIAIFALLIAITPMALGLFFSLQDNVVYENVVAIVYMRTYGMVGGLTGTYFDFFSTNEQTLYSHINIIGKFLDYPYGDPLGVVIGNYMGFEMNANTNFWATDGIAAAGIVGVLLIGIVMGLVLRLFDVMIPEENVVIICCAAGPVIISLGNSSFFTTLLTSGLLVLVFFGATWRQRSGRVMTMSSD